MKNIKFEKQDNLYIPGLTLIEGRLATNVKTKLNESQTENTGKKVRYKKQLNENMPADFEAALENSTPATPEDGLDYDVSATDESLDEAADEPEYIARDRKYNNYYGNNHWDTAKLDMAGRFNSLEDAKRIAGPNYDAMTYFPVEEESLNEAQETKHYRCSNCGYEDDLTDDEYDGCCPRCHEHHGEFVECDESLTEANRTSKFDPNKERYTAVAHEAPIPIDNWSAKVNREEAFKVFDVIYNDMSDEDADLLADTALDAYEGDKDALKTVRILFKKYKLPKWALELYAENADDQIGYWNRNRNESLTEDANTYETLLNKAQSLQGELYEIDDSGIEEELEAALQNGEITEDQARKILGILDFDVDDWMFEHGYREVDESLTEDTVDSNNKYCSHCGAEVYLDDCDTDQYWTDDGDRIVYHICPECGESVEEIQFEESLDESKYTKDELIDKFGTDDIDLINAGREENVELIDDHMEPKLEEDTVKQDGKWVNKGKEGTHGDCGSKKNADAQRAAMFAGGFKG